MARHLLYDGKQASYEHGWSEGRKALRTRSTCRCSDTAPVLIDAVFGNGLIPIRFDPRQGIWHILAFCFRCHRTTEALMENSLLPWYNDDLVAEATRQMAFAGCNHPQFLVGSGKVRQDDQTYGYLILCRKCRRSVFVPIMQRFKIENSSRDMSRFARPYQGPDATPRDELY